MKLTMGFIKSTDCLPTDHSHRPPTIYPRSTNSPTTDPRTHRPNNHQPTDNTMFKRLENMKTLMQTQLEKWKTIINLNKIKVFDWMNKICLNNLNIRKRNGSDNYIYLQAFECYCFIPPKIFVRPSFSFLLAVVLI